MFFSTMDDLVHHRTQEMREDAARQRRAYRLAAARRWNRRADRAAHRAELSRNALM